MIGSVLNHYKIVRHLGSGGMGDVYQAEDTKLHRQVALKLLPQEMADDPERRERFRREAKAVAALDHPNIVSIYSVEEADGQQFLVLQLAEGESLDELLSQGPLPLVKALEISQQVASALEAAHQAGIVHRDLKPSNVVVTADGRAKVLDFGIAKDLGTQPDPDATRTPTEHLTQTGHIVGTAPYLSPECIRGETPDKRADIWSFGCLMYEVLTGKRAFDRETFADTLAAIIEVEPDWDYLPAAAPPNVQLLVQSCLRKEPKRRVHDITGAKIEIEEALDVLRGVISAPSMAHPVPRGLKRPMRPATVGAVSAALIATGALVVWSLWPGGERAGSGSIAAGAAEATKLTDIRGEEKFPSLNPAGANFVYTLTAPGTDTSGIWVQNIGGTRPVNLTERSGADDTQPAFSPDGQRIAFRSERAGGGIFYMAADGGFPTQLTDDGYNPAWSPDGQTVVYATESTTDSTRFGFSEFWAVDLAMPMQPRLITAGDAAQPSYSPTGDRIAYWAISEETLESDIWTMSASGENPIRLTSDEYEDWNPVWSPTGDIYFLSDRGGGVSLWRVPVDPETGQTEGEPAPVTGAESGIDAHISVSGDGSQIAYVSHRGGHSLERIAFDPDSAEFVGYGGDITPDPGQWDAPSANANQNLVIVWREPGSGAPDLVVVQPDGASNRPLTDDDFEEGSPRWSPDEQTIAFHSDRSGTFEIWVLDASTQGAAPRRLTDTPDTNVMFPVWSPDGTRLAYTDLPNHASYVIEVGTSFADQTPEVLPPAEAGAWFEAWSWSPDGEWLAGLLRQGSAPAGIAIYSLATQEYRKLTDSGSFPVWLNDSRRLLFHERGRVFLLDTRSEERREVVGNIPGAVREKFALSPDNQTIYYTIENRESEIWLLDFRGGSRR